MTGHKVHPFRVRESGRFDLPLSPKDAFPLFTAEGESLWVPGWHPKILGETPQHPGLVFLTGEAEESTIWTVLESDPHNGRVRYSRVTPGSRAGTVEVKVSGKAGGSRVEVAYDLTALSAAGEKALQAYVGKNYSDMLAQWRTLIGEYLSRPTAGAVQA